MGMNSAIEWTEATWNPATGCTKISPGCAHCYAERMANRLQAMGQPNYASGFKVACHQNAIDLPIHWKKPRKIFVNSMSDLFHKAIPDEFILKVFEVMSRADWHQYQILTKRSDRLVELNAILDWQPNIWMGVTVEDSDYTYRIRHLRKTSAFVKFLSLEPLLGPMNDLDLDGIDWVVVGGESGPGARPVNPQWVIDIRDQCNKVGVAFFFKQWGGVHKKKNGRLLEGRLWNEMPIGIGR
ncbi:MAG: phage Gp37/Gp68 family protein [Planctomycetes bacterium]|nr:phage Gp37/Gp68 family protein [Planctomycetota bacterium]